MTDEALCALAQAAGLAPRWTDNTGTEQHVAPDVLRAALAALGLPAATQQQIAESQQRLSNEQHELPLRIAVAGAPTQLSGVRGAGFARVEFEQGGVCDLRIDEDGFLPAISRTGYHRLLIGSHETALAVAPSRARTLEDVGRGARMWGVSAQIYGLRSPGDGGIGHFGAVADLAESAARRGADLVGVSPAHALFLADESHYTPYSPSTRLFLNALYGDPALVLGAERVAAAAAALQARAPASFDDLIDWPEASQARIALLRVLFDNFCATDLMSGAPLVHDFGRFRAEGGAALEAHAIFEALHADQFGPDFTKWNWRDWPAELRDARSPEVAAFARAHAREIDFHVFVQWLADRSLARAQGRALAAGMRVGLVSDLAVGMNPGGSHAWSRPDELLLGLSVGAPPDMLAPRGQNWGLTTFSPRALRATGYAPFLATLRAALRNAGGVRIDHVMGLVRLWLTPDGAEATEGVYLSYPFEELLALLCLESERHRAIVIGEDLGTVPHGLRDRLAQAGVAGMRVLQFEREHDRFRPPEWYPASAVAMTATHDTPTLAGWWRGNDIDLRAGLDQLPVGRSREDCEAERAGERAMAWRAFREAGVAEGAEPPTEKPVPVLDAALDFVAATPGVLAVLPLEDLLGLDDQPNLPGTTTEHPNWRRRYPGLAADVLTAPAVAARLASIAARRN